eukprot:scaffold14923_cov149-Skeletonema_dohrnii-CCMP3373.AAC.2
MKPGCFIGLAFSSHKLAVSGKRIEEKSCLPGNAALIDDRVRQLLRPKKTSPMNYWLIAFFQSNQSRCIIFHMDLESEEDASSVVSEDASEVGSQSSSEDSA